MNAGQRSSTVPAPSAPTPTPALGWMTTCASTDDTSSSAVRDATVTEVPAGAAPRWARSHSPCRREPRSANVVSMGDA